MKAWTPSLGSREGPRYLAIAEAISVRHRRRQACAGRPPASAEGIGAAPVSRLHDGRARLCRGRQAGTGRIRRRARHVRPSRRDGSWRTCAWPFACRLRDEHAARAGGSGSHRAHAGGVRERRRGPRVAAALPGLWRLAGRSGRRLGLVRPSRARSGSRSASS